MTIMGHGLSGAAVGLWAAPAGAGRARVLITLLVFAALANVPDLPLPCWGHNRYEISHSLLVNLALVLGLGLALWRWRGLRPRLVLLGAVAWCSHLLLDSLYNHGKGVAIVWPFSADRLALPLPWFSTAHGPLWRPDMHLLRVMAMELLCYGALFLMMAAVRWIARRRGAARW